MPALEDELATRLQDISLGPELGILSDCRGHFGVAVAVGCRDQLLGFWRAGKGNRVSEGYIKHVGLYAGRDRRGYWHQFRDDQQKQVAESGRLRVRRRALMELHHRAIRLMLLHRAVV